MNIQIEGIDKKYIDLKESWYSSIVDESIASRIKSVYANFILNDVIHTITEPIILEIPIREGKNILHLYLEYTQKVNQNILKNLVTSRNIRVADDLGCSPIHTYLYRCFTKMELPDVQIVRMLSVFKDKVSLKPILLRTDLNGNTPLNLFMKYANTRFIDFPKLYDPVLRLLLECREAIFRPDRLSYLPIHSLILKDEDISEYLNPLPLKNTDFYIKREDSLIPLADPINTLETYFKESLDFLNGYFFLELIQVYKKLKLDKRDIISYQLMRNSACGAIRNSHNLRCCDTVYSVSELTEYVFRELDSFLIMPPTSNIKETDFPRDLYDPFSDECIYESFPMLKTNTYKNGVYYTDDKKHRFFIDKVKNKYVYIPTIRCEFCNSVF